MRNRTTCPALAPTPVHPGASSYHPPRPCPLPVRHTALLLATLLLATIASGCIGQPTDNEVPIEPAVDMEPQPDNEPERPGAAQPIRVQRSAPLRFALDDAIDTIRWHNGSFTTTDTGLGGGFATGAFVQHIDLTPHVPANVPTRLDITVTLDADQIPVAGPTARADPTSNGTTWYEAHWQSAAPGVFTFGGIVKRAPDGTIGINVEAYTPGPDEPPELDYTVRSHVTARPDRIPLGVPVAIRLDSNDTLFLHTQPDNQAELLIYGPDDRLLDRLFLVGKTQWTVPRGASGELVILPILGAADLGIVGPRGPTLRALDLHRATGEPHGIDTMTTTEWDFDVSKRPVRILVTVLGTGGSPWTCAGNLHVTLHSAETTILESSSSCPSPTNVPFLYEERRTWATHTGDPAVGAGRYTVTIDNTLWSGHQAYHAVETYVR